MTPELKEILHEVKNLYPEEDTWLTVIDQKEKYLTTLHEEIKADREKIRHEWERIRQLEERVERKQHAYNVRKKEDHKILQGLHHLSKRKEHCWVYLLKFKTHPGRGLYELFYKVGITGDVEKRVASIDSACRGYYDITILKRRKGTERQCLIWEENYLALTTELGFHYQPREEFSGSVLECFSQLPPTQ